MRADALDRSDEAVPGQSGHHVEPAPGHPAGPPPAPAKLARRLEIFTQEALKRLRESEEPPTGGEAELAGPWRVVRLARRDFGVFQPGEDTEADPPFGRFTGRHVALLAGAALPGLGRAGSFRVGPEAGENGYPLLRGGMEVGTLSYFLAELATALDLLDAVVRSPLALALLLEAAGPTALERSGRVLGRRLATVLPDEED